MKDLTNEPTDMISSRKIGRGSFKLLILKRDREEWNGSLGPRLENGSGMDLTPRTNSELISEGLSIQSEFKSAWKCKIMFSKWKRW